MSKLTLSNLSCAILLASIASQSYANDKAPPPPTLVEPKIMTEIETPVFDGQKTLEDLAQKQASNQNTAAAAQAAESAAADELIKNQNTTNITAESTPEEVYALLEKNPQAFEELLLRSISSQDAAALKTLLPAYERYENKDQSVIDWGNALIALQSGDTKKAVQIYRSINAALPNIRLLRLQMASALYQNRQHRAAKSELEKLLREEMPDSERQMLTNYLTVMKRADKWSFNFSGSFVKDDNLEDAPPVGTRIGNESSNLTYTTPHEKGTGISYNLGADKKWSFDNKSFVSTNVGVGGTYYWDNEKFNDVSANASIGVGYQSAKSEIEFAPTFGKSWYGGGVSAKDGDESLKEYTTSKGFRISASTWANPNVLLQHSSQISNLKYEEPYQNNDGDIYSMMNGVLYAPNARQYYGVYWNISKKDGVNNADSYERSGVNFSWNNTWNKGFTTLATLGIASKKYDGQNFAGITRHNTEYTAGLSFWKRDFSILGLTPRLNISTKKVKSNYAFDKNSDTTANVMFTKTF